MNENNDRLLFRHMHDGAVISWLVLGLTLGVADSHWFYVKVADAGSVQTAVPHLAS